MEGYTGEGEPPCIVMTLKTTDMSPPDLSVPIILTGVREPSNTLLIKRSVEGNDVSTSTPGLALTSLGHISIARGRCKLLVGVNLKFHTAA